MSDPTPGDIWRWPDGRLAVLTPDDIADGRVVARWFGRNVIHYLRDGRRDDSATGAAVAQAVYGAPDVQ